MKHISYRGGYNCLCWVIMAVLSLNGRGTYSIDPDETGGAVTKKSTAEPKMAGPEEGEVRFGV